MQAGSAASLEWSVAWLTNGRPRGCLKPILECAVGHVGTLAAAVGVTRKTVDWMVVFGVGVDHGAAGTGCYIGGLDGFRWLDGARKAASWVDTG